MTCCLECCELTEPYSRASNADLSATYTGLTGELEFDRVTRRTNVSIRLGMVALVTFGTPAIHAADVPTPPELSSQRAPTIDDREIAKVVRFRIEKQRRATSAVVGVLRPWGEPHRVSVQARTARCRAAMQGSGIVAPQDSLQVTEANWRRGVFVDDQPAIVFSLECPGEPILHRANFQAIRRVGGISTRC